MSVSKCYPRQYLNNVTLFGGKGLQKMIEFALILFAFFGSFVRSDNIALEAME